MASMILFRIRRVERPRTPPPSSERRQSSLRVDMIGSRYTTDIRSVMRTIRASDTTAEQVCLITKQQGAGKRRRLSGSSEAEVLQLMPSVGEAALAL